jgi:glycine/D-amino acid oxidase-like deaminating enzyme
MHGGKTSNSANARDKVDVIVIGGGIVGLCVTWFLSREGLDVLCLDGGQPGGSTANAGSLHVQMQSRLMRLFPQRIPDYLGTLPLYPRAVEFWKTVEQELGRDIDLSIGGGLMVAETRRQLDELEVKVKREQALGVDSALLDRRELLELAPYLYDGVHGAAYCRQEGKLNPLSANRAIRARASACGANICRRRRVTGIEHRDDGQMRVDTTAGSHLCARVVIAAGAGTAELTRMLGYEVPVVAEPLHMNITEPAQPLLGHLIQHAEMPITLKQFKNGQIVIGGGWPADPAEGNRGPSVRLASIRGNLALAARLVPSIRKLRVVRTWAGVNPTVDLLSVIGELPGHAGIYVVVPGDAGYTLGPYCAHLLVDLMQQRRADFPLDGFAPERLQARHRTSDVAGSTPP